MAICEIDLDILDETRWWNNGNEYHLRCNNARLYRVGDVINNSETEELYTVTGVYDTEITLKRKHNIVDCCNDLIECTLVEQQMTLERLREITLFDSPSDDELNEITASQERVSTNVIFALAQFHDADDYAVIKDNHAAIDKMLAQLRPWCKLVRLVQDDPSLVDKIKQLQVMAT